jgi:hypothetical protein
MGAPVSAAVGWCPECGPIGEQTIDEEGCCSCGCTAVGPGADRALKSERLLAQLQRDVRRAWGVSRGEIDPSSKRRARG